MSTIEEELKKLDNIRYDDEPLDALQMKLKLEKMRRDTNLLEKKLISSRRNENARNSGMVAFILGFTLIGVISSIFLLLNLIFKWV
jgi:hypothetical protein